MNIHAPYPTTPEEFLRWNEGREGKREFVRGRVVEMMVNVTRNHVLIASNLLFALRRRLNETKYLVGSADFAIRTPDGVRYPDVFVDRNGPAATGHDLAATEPILLAEILSPSSIGRDFVEKDADYKGLPSLSHYLILSHEGPRIWLSTRDAGLWSRPIEQASIDAVIELPALGVSLPMADLYAGVALNPSS